MGTKNIKQYSLPASSLGNSRTLTAISYGNPSQPHKAYIQAGLHANEAPGFMAMHYLINMLDEADEAGQIVGQITLVPVANPIGISQWRDQRLEGRFDFYNNINFNREHADLSEGIADRVKDRLGSDPVENVTLIRRAAAETLESIVPEDEAGFLKHLLLSLCYDAEIVLDLHCDDQSVVHVYTGTPLWPDAADLAAQLGAEVTLLAEDSGVTPFDEASSRIWWQLATTFPDYPIPPACLSATVEFRGITDVTHEYGKMDADNIFCFLQRREFIDGKASDLPALQNQATPLRGVAHLKAPVPGVVVFLKNPGDRINKGDAIAEIINPVAEKPDDRITVVRSEIDGILFSTRTDHYARPGRILAKIAGKTPLKDKGENLLTL
jgi:hypothetical protein